MSTHNMYFQGEIRKTMFPIPLLSRAIGYSLGATRCFKKKENYNTLSDLITAHAPISAQSSHLVVSRLQPIYLFLYNNICCWYSFELP